MSRYFAHYQDDGPDGPCGQAVSTTSPWSRLYFYEGPNAEADAYALVRNVREGGAGRRNPRVTAIWSEEDGNAFPGLTSSDPGDDATTKEGR